VPTARDFVPWRFSDAGHSARGWHRHAGVRETCTTPDLSNCSKSCRPTCPI